MRLFRMVRDRDHSGVSGVGEVAEAVVFTDGTAALRWRSSTASTGLYASLRDLRLIHGHGGTTRLVFGNREVGEMLAVALGDPADAPLLVDALLLAAEVERVRDPRLARRYGELADGIGDALDRSPAVPEWQDTTSG